MINNYIKAAEAAKIGIWEINLVNETVYWDSVVKQIVEVPSDYVPIRTEFYFFFLVQIEIESHIFSKEQPGRQIFQREISTPT
jgi:hypothetical protein